MTNKTILTVFVLALIVLISFFIYLQVLFRKNNKDYESWDKGSKFKITFGSILLLSGIYPIFMWFQILVMKVSNDLTYSFLNYTGNRPGFFQILGPILFPVGLMYLYLGLKSRKKRKLR